MRGNTLKEIKADKLKDVYSMLTEMAVQWAAAGLIQQANALLETLWSHGLEHDRNTWIADQALQQLWHVSGTYPNNIPFQLEAIEVIEQGSWENLFFPFRWSTVYMDRVMVTEEEELDKHGLMVKALHLAYDDSAPDHKASPNRQLKALELLEKAMAITEHSEGDPFHLLTYATILAANNNQLEKAKAYLLRWGGLYPNHPQYFDLYDLMRNKIIAGFLSSGMLAPSFQLSGEQCEKDLAAISLALEKRIKEGQSLVYGHLSWKVLLKKISKQAIAKDDLDFEEEVKKGQWLGHNPATKKQIKENEQRLGIVLPDDYRNFLATTNGFRCYNQVTATLLPIEKVDWLNKLDPEVVSIYYDSDIYEPLKRSLLIGGHEEEQQLLLVPDETGEAWECWFFASWNPIEDRYPSFRAYMEKELMRLEERNE